MSFSDDRFNASAPGDLSHGTVAFGLSADMSEIIFQSMSNLSKGNFEVVFPPDQPQGSIRVIARAYHQQIIAFDGAYICIMQPPGGKLWSRIWVSCNL